MSCLGRRLVVARVSPLRWPKPLALPPLRVAEPRHGSMGMQLGLRAHVRNGIAADVIVALNRELQMQRADGPDRHSLLAPAANLPGFRTHNGSDGVA